MLRYAFYSKPYNSRLIISQALDRFIQTPGFGKLPFEARQTALIFQHDFQKSGVHLPDEQRKKFVQLSSDIIAHGRDFLQGLETPKRPVVLTRQDCEGVPEKSSRMWQLFALRKGMRSSISVDPDSPEARRVLRFSTNEESRKKIYVAQNTSVPENIEALEQLLRARADLAVLVGHKSYADMLLMDKMGSTPGTHIYYIPFEYQCLFRTRSNVSRFSPSRFETTSSISIRRDEGGETKAPRARQSTSDSTMGSRFLLSRSRTSTSSSSTIFVTGTRNACLFSPTQEYIWYISQTCRRGTRGSLAQGRTETGGR